MTSKLLCIVANAFLAVSASSLASAGKKTTLAPNRVANKKLKKIGKRSDSPLVRSFTKAMRKEAMHSSPFFRAGKKGPIVHTVNERGRRFQRIVAKRDGGKLLVLKKNTGLTIHGSYMHSRITEVPIDKKGKAVGKPTQTLKIRVTDKTIEILQTILQPHLTAVDAEALVVGEHTVEIQTRPGSSLSEGGTWLRVRNKRGIPTTEGSLFPEQNTNTETRDVGFDSGYRKIGLKPNVISDIEAKIFHDRFTEL